MVARRPGAGRYARPEREQRWLLAQLPEDRHGPVDVLDHYLRGTRLRLRRMRSEDETVWKLGQKIREQDHSPEVVHLTNIYLSRQEYSAFTGLAASVLGKTRWRWEFGGVNLAVDEFHGALTGLVLAEVELATRDERLGPPPGALADVTDDNRFSGGALAALDDHAATSLVLVVMGMEVGPAD